MNKFIFVYTFSFVLSGTVQAQQVSLDSLSDYEKKVLDSLDKDLDEFLKFGAMSKSFVDISMSAANGYYNFKNNNNIYLNTSSNFTVLPSLAYYHKSGFAISGTGCGVYTNESMNFYQFIVSPSFIYSDNKTFSTGIVYSHFFSKDSLQFYKTPLNNEIFLNFVWQKWWLEPSIAFGYGWGSRSGYKKEVGFIQALLARMTRRRITTVTEESVHDLALSVAIKHNFSWHHLFSAKDILLFTPQCMITAGSSHFGFNTSYSFRSHYLTSNLLPSNSNINEDRGLELQSLSALMRIDYIIRSFYIEPQFIVDYYLPYTQENRLHCIAGITAGLNF